MGVNTIWENQHLTRCRLSENNKESDLQVMAPSNFRTPPAVNHAASYDGSNANQISQGKVEEKESRCIRNSLYFNTKIKPEQ